MIRLAVSVRRADAEVALAQLLELAPAGVEETDLGETIEYAIYGAPGELPKLPEMEALAGDALVGVSSSEIADDWDERWKAFHRPLTVGGRLHVRPPWSPPPDGTLLDVVIDPGPAFGTGAHATTRLCLELLLELDAPRGGLADLGCGSGVLAIAAARLGHAPVIAIDSEPESVAAARANAAANCVQLKALRRDLRGGEIPPAQTYVANLLRPLLLALAERLARHRPRAVIASGLLRHEADEVAEAFAPHGLPERDRRELGDWLALLLAQAPS